MGKKETKVQTQIKDWLKDNHFYCFKCIVSSVDGTSDIIAVSPKGRYIAIEVKQGSGRPSALQLEFINEVNKRGGIGFVSWDLQTVIHKLQGEIEGGYAGEEDTTDTTIYL